LLVFGLNEELLSFVLLELFLASVELLVDLLDFLNLLCLNFKSLLLSVLNHSIQIAFSLVELMSVANLLLASVKLMELIEF
jgi:hypothetical protein